MNEIMMRLGAYRFAMDTAAYNDMTRTAAYRWASVETQAGPGFQYMGPGEDAMTLSGIVYPHFMGGLGQLDAMRAEALKGKPLLMTDGLGSVRGFWIIKNVRETGQKFAAGGVARRQTFSMNLAYYGDKA